MLKILLAIIFLAAGALAQNANWTSTLFQPVTMPAGFWTGNTDPHRPYAHTDSRLYMVSAAAVKSKSTAAIVTAPTDTSGWTDISTGFQKRTSGDTSLNEFPLGWVSLANGDVGVLTGNIGLSTWHLAYGHMTPTAGAWTFSSSGLPTTQPFSGIRPGVVQDPTTGYIYVWTWRAVYRSTNGGATFALFTVNGIASGSATLTGNLGFSDVGIYGLTIHTDGYMYVEGETSGFKVATANFTTNSVYAFATATGNCATPSNFCHNGFATLVSPAEIIIQKNCPQGLSYLCRIDLATSTITDEGYVDLTPYGAAGKNTGGWLSGVLAGSGISGGILKGAATGEYFWWGYALADSIGAIFGSIDGGNTWSPVGWTTLFTCVNDTSVNCPKYLTVDVTNDNKFFTRVDNLYFHPGVTLPPIPPSSTHPILRGLGEPYGAFPTLLDWLKRKACTDGSGGCVITADMTALKSAANTYAAQSVPAYARYAGSGITYNYQGGPWKIKGEVLALAHLIWGDSPTDYGAKAIQILDRAVDTNRNLGTLTIDGSNNKKVTASGWTFLADATSNDVSTYIRVDSGAGWTPGWYQVASVSAGAAILATSPGAVGLTGGAWTNTIPASVDSGYPTRNVMVVVSEIYDMVNDRIDTYVNPNCSGCETTREADTFNLLNAWAAFALAKGYQIGGQMYSNYQVGHLIGIASVAYGTSGDNSNALSLQNSVTNTLWKATNFTTGGYTGGFIPEGNNVGYGFATAQWVMLVMQMVKDVGLTDLGIVTNGTKFATHLIYALKPDRWSTINEGDMPNGCNLTMPIGLALQLAFHLKGQTAGAWMQYMYSNFATAPNGCSTQFGAGLVEKALYSDSSNTSTDYSATQNKYYRSTLDEHLYVRSDWTTSAVWGVFHGGGVRYSVDHEMHSAGNILLNRGSDYLLVNSGQWAGTTGNSGTPVSFDQANWRLNTLYFDDNGGSPERCRYSLNGNTPFIGCQDSSGTSSVSAFGTGTNYIYEKGNLQSAYLFNNLSNISTYLRSFVFLGDKYFVVYDYAVNANSSYPTKQFWHSNRQSQWSLASTRATSTVGSSKITLDTLLPASATFAVAADGDTNGGMGGTNPVTYRLEVSNAVSSTTLAALNTFCLDASATTCPTPAYIATVGSTHVGAYIPDATPRMVFFSSNGSARTSLNFTRTWTGTARIVAADMTASGNFYYKDLGSGNIDIKNSTGSGYILAAASSAGVVAFDITSSGSVGMTSFTAACSSSTTAGVAVNCTVTAIGSDGNTFTPYTGTPTKTSSDAQFSSGSCVFAGGDLGVKTCTFTPKTTGTQTITYTDGSYTGISNGVSTTPAAAATCTLTGFPSLVFTNSQSDFTLAFFDAFSNVATTYTGTNAFTANLAATLPSNYAYTAPDVGTNMFSATPTATGALTLTATDAGNSITCNQSGITVQSVTAPTFFPAIPF